MTQTVARVTDKKNKKYTHLYRPFRYGVDHIDQEAHVFTAQDCWCNTAVITDWSKMASGQPYVFIYHQGAHDG